VYKKTQSYYLKLESKNQSCAENPFLKEFNTKIMGSFQACSGASAHYGASLRCLETNAQSIGKKQWEFKVCFHLQGCVFLESQRYGETAYMTGVLQ